MAGESHNFLFEDTVLQAFASASVSMVNKENDADNGVLRVGDIEWQSPLRTRRGLVIAETSDEGSFLSRAKRRGFLFTLKCALALFVVIENLNLAKLMLMQKSREVKDVFVASSEHQNVIRVLVEHTSSYTGQVPVVNVSSSQGDVDTSTSKSSVSEKSMTMEKPGGILTPGNRTIAMIHVGKAGGTSLRSLTRIRCSEVSRGQMKKTKKDIDACMNEVFANDTVLPNSVRYYMHWAHIYNASEIEDATSFLFTVRNPVDRIISAYKYQHPVLCNRNVGSSSLGCRWTNFLEKDGHPIKILYGDESCTTLEMLAQSSMGPWSNTSTPACRKVARKVVQGHGHKFYTGHLHFNYEYYANKTIHRYPNKEVFVVRTDREIQDVEDLDRKLGGSGNLHGSVSIQTFGSESYKNKMALSKSGYQKLCCVLEKELAIYESLIERAKNLDRDEKERTVAEVHRSCGIGDVEEWRRQCLQQLNTDTMGDKVSPT